MRLWRDAAQREGMKGRREHEPRARTPPLACLHYLTYACFGCKHTGGELARGGWSQQFIAKKFLDVPMLRAREGGQK